MNRRMAVTIVLAVCLCLSGMVFPYPAARADTSLKWEQVGQPMSKMWWPAVDPEVVPFMEAGKTYMPVNFIASSLGATVSYDATTKIVTITLKEA